MNRRRSLELKRANISFYESRLGKANITREIPESDFAESKFGVKLDPSSLVVEIGCGTASILLSLNAKKKVGLDISLANLMLAKQRSSELVLVQADAEHTPFKRALFDVVVMVDLLHHVPNSHAVIEEAARILKSGGKLFIFDSCVDGVMPIYPFAMLTQKIIEKVGQHIEHFGPSLEDVVKWLIEADFKIVSLFGEGSFIRYVNSILTSLSKRAKIPQLLVGEIPRVNNGVEHLFKRFPIKFGGVAIKMHNQKFIL